MSRLTFFIVLALSFLYPLATMVETTMYQLRIHSLEHQRDLESQLAVAQHTNSVAQQLVQRMSIDSMRDPSLAVLLRKYGIRVKISAPPGGTLPPGVPGAPPAGTTPSTIPAAGAVNPPSTAVPTPAPIPGSDANPAPAHP